MGNPYTQDMRIRTRSRHNNKCLPNNSSSRLTKVNIINRQCSHFNSRTNNHSSRAFNSPQS